MLIRLEPGDGQKLWGFDSLSLRYYIFLGRCIVSIRLKPILDRLARGEQVEHCESGNSMKPIIKHRQPVTLSPVDTSKIEKDDIVLAKVSGRYYLHKVNAIEGDQVQIANNHGRINGWTNRSHVYAIVSAIDGKPRPSAQGKIKEGQP